MFTEIADFNDAGFQCPDINIGIHIPYFIHIQVEVAFFFALEFFMPVAAAGCRAGGNIYIAPVAPAVDLRYPVDVLGFEWRYDQRKPGGYTWDIVIESFTDHQRQGAVTELNVIAQLVTRADADGSVLYAFIK